MRQWVRGSVAGTALITAGLLVGASAFASPLDDVIDLPIDFTIAPTELTIAPTEDPTSAPDPTEDPTEDDPADDPDPTEEPTTDDPTEDPTTDEPTEEPTTEEPTEEPTTDEPTGDPTVAPTTGQPVDLEEGGPGLPGMGGAPTFAAIPSITAASRADVTEADLMAGVRVFDDVDARLFPTISSWGGWFSESECPGGYPCTYRIVYLVFDADDNFAEATRDVIITGRQSTPIGGALGGAGNYLVDGGFLDSDAVSEAPQTGVDTELPWTGVDTEHLLLLGGFLVAGGTGLLYTARRAQIR